MSWRDIVKWILHIPWNDPETCHHPWRRVVNSEDGPATWKCLDCGKRGWR